VGYLHAIIKRINSTIMKKNFKNLVFFGIILTALLFVSVGVYGQAKPKCGDNRVDTGEECDDGNKFDNDTCSSSCKLTYCGDGVVQSPNGGGSGQSVYYEKCDLAGEGYCSNNSKISCNNDDKCGAGNKCIFPCTADCGMKLMGWAWGGDTGGGWISLNNDNCFHLDKEVIDHGVSCANTDTNYYIQVASDQANSLKGFAWSENVGWICFGSDCSQTEICRNARVGFVCDPTIYGTTVPSTPGGWMAKVQDYNVADSPVLGWGKYLINGDDGWLSLNSQNEPVGFAYPYGLSLISKYYSPNGNSNDKILRKSLMGWAWNDSSNAGGLGWVYFTPDRSKPWLETRLGDIYAQKGITTPAPAGSFNATYRILGNTGNIEAITEQTGGTWLDPQYGPIDFPTPLTRYSNVLGKIDIDGLVCIPANGQTTCINKYDKKVKYYKPGEESTLINDLNSVGGLGGYIYYMDGDLIINRSITFRNTTDFVSGAGTIIVNGNLTFQSNVIYDPADNLTKFKNLASAAWIVKGDINVDPAVQNPDLGDPALVGAFIVLGKSNVTCPQVGCGNFNTGVAANQLTISGLVMARQFNFQRQGSYGTIGSELIIYDGRLLANIPPGLDDFAQALPIWREGVFSR
jgi:cysteine-rich repeat protein